MTFKRIKGVFAAACLCGLAQARTVALWPLDYDTYGNIVSRRHNRPVVARREVVQPEPALDREIAVAPHMHAHGVVVEETVPRDTPALHRTARDGRIGRARAVGVGRQIPLHVV